MSYYNSYYNIPWVDFTQNAPKKAPHDAPIEPYQEDEDDSYDFDQEDLDRRQARGRVARYRDEDTPFGLDASDF